MVVQERLGVFTATGRLNLSAHIPVMTIRGEVMPDAQAVSYRICYIINASLPEKPLNVR